MRLLELDPEFVKITAPATWQIVESIAEADGVYFCCPTCYAKNGNTIVGTHRILCWQPRVPQSIGPTPGRWNLVGRGLDDLSLVAGSSSVFLNNPDGCLAHFVVRDGQIVPA